MKKALLVILVSLLTSVNSFASDDDLGIVVCAAVLPCDGKGGVLESFRGGECGRVYAEQCSSIVTMSSAPRIERRYAQCKIASKKKDITIRSLKKQLRAALRARHALAQ